MYRHDIIAQLYYARRLAEKLQPVARMIELHGGHLVSHERTKEVYFTSVGKLTMIQQIFGLWCVHKSKAMVFQRSLYKISMIWKFTPHDLI